MDDLNLRLLFKAKHGDSRAFEQLVTPYEQMIWRVCWRLMGNRFDAEDVVQLTMIKTWKHIRQYKGKSSFSSWMYRIAVHSCMDVLREKSHEKAELYDEIPESVHLAETETTPESEMLKMEYNERIQKGLNALDNEQKIPLILFAVEAKSYDEISEILGIPAGTVKSRISRGRERLRKMIENIGKEAR